MAGPKSWTNRLETLLEEEYHRTIHFDLDVAEMDRVFADEHGLTEAAVRAKRRRMGLVRVDETLEPDDMHVERVVEARADKIVESLEKKEARTILRKYAAAKLELERQDRLIAAAKEIAAAMPPAAVEVEKDYGIHDPRMLRAPFVVHAPTTDEHVGLYNWAPETWGGDYDTDIACQRLVQHAKFVASWVQMQPGKCVRLHRTFVGDLLHSLLGETEHGTPLDQDGRSARVWGLLMQTLRDVVEILRPVCDTLHINGARGNHDGEIEFFLAMHTLSMLYEDCPDVRVTVSPGRQAGFFEQDTLHVLDHGYKIGHLSAPLAIAALDRAARIGAGDELWRRAEQVKVYVGHKHKRESNEVDDRLELIRLPALCETDDHASGLRFKNTSGASVFRLDDQGRIETERRIYVNELEP